MQVKSSILLLFLVSFTKLFAQSDNEFFSMGIGLGGTSYYSFGSTTHVNLRAQITTSEGSEAINACFQYQVPFQTNNKVNASAIDYNNPIREINVPYQTTYSHYHGTINYLYTISDSDIEDYYFYTFGGIGAGLLKNTYSFNDYDKTAYKIYYSNRYTDQDFITLNMDFGLGVNYDLNRFKLFGEVKGTLMRIIDQEFDTENTPNFVTSLQVGLSYIIVE